MDVINAILTQNIKNLCIRYVFLFNNKTGKYFMHFLSHFYAQQPSLEQWLQGNMKKWPLLSFQVYLLCFMSPLLIQKQNSIIPHEYTDTL